MARARLDAAARQAGFELAHCAAAELVSTLRETPYEALVLDLDGGREPLLEQLEAVRREGLAPSTVVGYYSHIDDALGAAARAAGCTPYPRGRFWRELPQLLGSFRD